MTKLYDYEFRGNEQDDRHCLQASFGMAWEALTGEHLPLAELEELTGFVPGVSSWPFKAMLAAAARGFRVRYIEDSDLELFVQDPRADILRTFDGDEAAAERIIARSRPDAQVEAAAACIAHPRIELQARIPDLADLRHLVSTPATVVICAVNYFALAGREGYNGHSVVVADMDETSVVLDNPGLPPVAGQRVTIERFCEAWAPTPKHANIFAVSALDYQDTANP